MHELVHMLDSIEDELARRRFRESLYISFFVCVALAWVVLYGPRYLWHSPQLVNPSDVLQHREMVELNAPVLPHNAPSAPRAAPKVDTKTLEKLRSAAPPAPATPQPTASTPAPPSTPPMPATAPVLPSAPAPVARPAAPLADAPAPQPTSKPNFGTPSTADSMNSLLRIVHAIARVAQGFVTASALARVPWQAEALLCFLICRASIFPTICAVCRWTCIETWIPLLPEETEPPLMKQGETYIEFSILPDGRIDGMKLVGSTHDVAIDKAAWGSIVSEGQFPPLPKQFHGPNLTLRFHYLVNKNIQQ